MPDWKASVLELERYLNILGRAVRAMSKNKKPYLTVAFLVAIFVLYGAGIAVLQNSNKQIYTVTVTDKARVTYGHIYNTHKYLIYTIDGEGAARIFENTDSLLRMKFNSSDFYALIKTGETYEFTVIGYRLPFFSMYKNIISAAPVEIGNTGNGCGCD